MALVCVYVSVYMHERKYVYDLILCPCTCDSVRLRVAVL